MNASREGAVQMLARGEETAANDWHDQGGDKRKEKVTGLTEVLFCKRTWPCSQT